MSTSTRGVTRIGPVTFAWGARTYLMGILNVTPDSFSGDGLLQGGAAPGAAAAGAAATAEPGAADAAPRAPGAGDAVERAVARARRMVDEGADILDVGGESTRPGHAPVDDAEELARVVPVVRAIRAALPDTPISVDTTKPAVAASALEAGADCINDVWGTGSSDEMPHLAADRGAAYVLMHNRGEARYVDVVREVIADLQHGMDRAIAAGVPWESIVVDPGIGFGKTMEHNLVLLRHLADLSMLGRPILLGTSRKSTIGRVLGGLPPDERLEGTLATTALGIAAGVDIVRVHDVLPNARVARMCDAIVRIEEEARA
jgi:dihydropteroate synthase